MSMFDIFSLPSYWMETDQSVQVLDQLFGQAVIDVPLDGTTTQFTPDSLITWFVGDFNGAIVSASLIIFALILVLGTIYTAQEGKFLGKQWSSIWIPIRAIIAPVLIMPISQGFCLIQYIVLYFILVGVNIASTVWGEAVGQITTGYVPTVPQGITTAVNQQIGLAFMYGAIDAITNNIPQPDSSSQVNKHYQGSINFTPTVSQIPFNKASATFPSIYTDILTDSANICNAMGTSVATMLNKQLGIMVSAATEIQMCNNQFQSGVGNNFWTQVTSSNSCVGYNGNKPCGYYSIQDPNYPSVPDPYNPGTDEENNSWFFYIGGNWNGDGVYATNHSPQYDPVFGDPDAALDSTANTVETYNLYVTSKGKPDGAPDFSVNNQNYVLTADGLEDALFGTGFYNTYLLQTPSSGSTTTCDNDKCTFSPMTSSIISALSSMNSNSQAQLQETSMPGTGTTCPWTCRVIGSQTLTPQSSPAWIDDSAEYSISYANASPEFPTPSCVLKSSIGTPTYTLCNGSANDQTGCVAATQQCVVSNSDNTISVVEPITFGETKNATGQIMEPSWWYAGEVYLSLAQTMSTNINKLALAVQNLSVYQSQPAAVSPANNPSYSATLTVGYSEGMEPDITAPNGYIWTMWDAQSKTYTYTPSASAPINTVFNLDTNWLDNANYVFFGDPLTLIQPGPSPSVPQGVVPPAEINAQMTALQNFGNGADYNYYKTLSQLPSQFQPPIEILTALNTNSTTLSLPTLNCQSTASPIYIDQSLPQSSGSKQGGQPVYGWACTYVSKGKITQYVENILAVLAANGQIPTVGSTATSSIGSYGSNVNLSDPIQGVMNQIFNGLLSNTFDSTGSGDGAGVANIMNRIYNLGDVNVTDVNQIASEQFDMISQAQQLGWDMVSLVLNSITDVSTHFHNLATDNAAIVGTMAGVGTAGAIAASFTPMVTSGEVMMTATQLGIQIYTLVTMTQLSFNLVWLPVLIMVMTCLFTAGVGFALMLPLTPYILFWAGEMAWILGVIEAIIAAPLVMLAVAHPGGHDVVGHGSPALKMLLGVVFRPVLMVLGMLIGIVLTFIVISLSSQGFHIVGMSILANPVPGQDLLYNNNTPGILASLMVMIYVSFIMMAFTKCFSAIYVLPEKVMQWIGAHGEKAGAEDLEKISQASSQTSQQTASAGGQAVDKKAGAVQSEEQQLGQGSSTIHQAEREQVGSVKQKKAEQNKTQASKPPATDNNSGGGTS